MLTKLNVCIKMIATNEITEEIKRYLVCFLVLWLVEIGLTISCGLWIKDHYFTCQLPTMARSAFLGKREILFSSLLRITNLDLRL